MTDDRGFTHPNFGNEVHVELIGREVRLIFVAGTAEQAEDLAEAIVSQLESGTATITMVGQPTSMTEQ